jgi:hypothetical protein
MCRSQNARIPRNPITADALSSNGVMSCLLLHIFKLLSVAGARILASGGFPEAALKCLFDS